MKQKRIVLVAAFSLTLLATASLLWVRYTQLQPIVLGSNKTPIVSYDSPPGNNSSRPTLTEKAKQKANAPGPKQPTAEIPHTSAPPASAPLSRAPKQEEVRHSVAEEKIYYALGVPNDPGYTGNWALQKVNAPAAWNISTGNSQTIVAVIDSGFALNHEDLKTSWYQNPGETGVTKLGGRCWTGISLDKATNNCDDDNNGYIDDWRGWSFPSGDNNPMAGKTNPNGAGVAHGTETAGLSGAAGNNATGIATINWNTKVMPLQVLSDDGSGYTSDVAAAIYYAVDNGASVINMSLGGSEYDPALQTATDYAYAHSVVVVAAAGNCGTGTESGCSGLPAGSMGYPALNPHVISVGATTSGDQRASFSSYGPALDIAAPGSGSIVSPTWTPTNGTSLYSGTLYGTSFASPQVASLASLIKSIRPNSSVDDIIALMLATATKLPAMNSQPYTNELGHGVINAGAALQAAQSLNTSAATPILGQAGGVTSEHSYTSTDQLGSGCTVNANSFCTVRLYNAAKDYDRYLPYQIASAQGRTGWTWSGSILPSGQWEVRAVQGDYRSSTYPLGSK
jgi:hypothetical protein